MSVAQTCKKCGEEVAVEPVFPPTPLKCTHCGYEEWGDTNGNAIWTDVSAKDTLGKS